MTHRLGITVLVIVMAAMASLAFAEDIGGGSSDGPAVTAAPTQPAAAPAAPAVSDGGESSGGADVASEGGEGGDGGEGGKAPADGSGEKGGPEGPKGFNPLLLIGGAVLLMFLFMGGGRKQEKKRKEMLANIKKGDRVTTIGGIVGSVLEVREKDLLLKIDESNNTRTRVARWAIRTVGTPEDEDVK